MIVCSFADHNKHIFAEVATCIGDDHGVIVVNFV